MQNVCGNCNKEIGDVTFCPFCGLPQQCMNCGTKFESDERFCGNCGTKRENPAEQTAHETKEVDEQAIEEAKTQVEQEVTAATEGTSLNEEPLDKTDASTADEKATTSSTDRETTESSTSGEVTGDATEEEVTERKSNQDATESTEDEDAIENSVKDETTESAASETAAESQVVEQVAASVADEGPAQQERAQQEQVQQAQTEQAKDHQAQAHQTQTKQNKQEQPIFKKPPFIIGAIVIIGVIIAYFAGGFASDEKKIENTINAYMDAVGKFDFDKVEKLHHPHSPYIDDLNDFSDFPFDIEIEVHRIYDIGVYDDYADAIVLMSVSSSSYGDERYTDEVYVELGKYKRKWHIYDIY